MSARRTTVILNAGAAALAWAALSMPASAQTETDCPERPDYRNLRYEENWRSLADPTCMDGLFDRLKYMAIGESGGRYVSLGGEARLRYEFFNNGASYRAPRRREEHEGTRRKTRARKTGTRIGLSVGGRRGVEAIHHIRH